MFRHFFDRFCATDITSGIFHFDRAVNGTTNIARIAVLVLRVALRAVTFNEAVGQEHLVCFTVGLLDRLCVDVAALFEF